MSTNEELISSIKANQRAFQHISTGEVKYLLTDEESENPFWIDVMIIPNLSNEVMDEFLAPPPVAQEAVNEQIDPLQGAVDWLFHGLLECTVGDIQDRLLIGFNRANRLYQAAEAAELTRAGDPRYIALEKANVQLKAQVNDLTTGWRIALGEAHALCMSAYRGFYYKQAARDVNEKILKIADRLAELQNNPPESWGAAQAEKAKGGS